MTSKLDKYSVNSKKTTKYMISGMKLEESNKPLSVAVKGRASNGNVKSYQVQTNNKTYLQRDQGQINKALPDSSKIINRECSSKNLSNKSEMEKTSKSKHCKVKLSASHLQSQESAGSTLTASVKQAESLHVQKSARTVAGDVSASDNGQHTVDKQLKQKKSAKKKQDGASNWMKLCATLNIDGAKRKTKPMKRAASDDVTDQGDNSQVKRTKPDVWFDNVDKILIETESSEQSQVATDGNSDNKQMTDPLVKPDSFKGVTNCLAIDCEMVGVGPEGQESILARVSVVNHFGVCLYDKFVQPREKVTDYRTHVSGVTAELLATGEEFTKVQSEVSDLIKDRILVGHAVHNDLKVLFLTHPHRMIRDTSLYKPFRELFKGRLPSLKKLTDKVLGVSVQDGQHSSVQDAQATMRLYTMYRQKWEKQLRQEKKMGKRRKKKQAKQEND